MSGATGLRMLAIEGLGVGRMNVAFWVLLVENVRRFCELELDDSWSTSTVKKRRRGA
jgi:hypothetical protein